MEKVQLVEKQDALQAAHTTAAELLAHLEGLGIVAQTYEHAPVFSVAEALEEKDNWEWQGTKCLFLKDKREDRLWLVAVPDEKRVNLKGLSDTLGCGRFSFASTETLQDILGVIPGSVTIFGLINDKKCQVEVVMDADLTKRDKVSFHPLRNDRTTTLAPADVLKFIESCGHRPLVIEVPAVAET